MWYSIVMLLDHKAICKAHPIVVLASYGHSDSEMQFTGLQKQFANWLVDYNLTRRSPFRRQ
jgi:hypothetical protein